MATSKPEKATGKEEEVTKPSGSGSNDGLFQKRLQQWRQPFLCPFCGKTDCNNFRHLVKLFTLPRPDLRPKHFFLLYGVLFILLTFFLGIYMTVKIHARG